MSFSETKKTMEPPGEVAEQNVMEVKAAAKMKRIKLKEKSQEYDVEELEARRKWERTANPMDKSKLDSIQKRVKNATNKVMEASKEDIKLFTNEDEFKDEDLIEWEDIARGHLDELRKDSDDEYASIRKYIGQHGKGTTPESKEVLRTKLEKLQDLSIDVVVANGVLKDLEVRTNAMEEDGDEELAEFNQAQEKLDQEIQDYLKNLEEELKTANGAGDGLFVPLNPDIPVPSFEDTNGVSNLEEELKTANGAGDGLFVPLNPDIPVLGFEDTNGVSNPIAASNDPEEDSDDPEDLYSPAIARKRAGKAPDKFRLEGYRGLGRGTTAVTGRGPKNSTSYRLERLSGLGGIGLEDHIPDITQNRWGEMRRKEKYNKSHFYGIHNKPQIQGVAWFYRDSEKEPLNMLIPIPRDERRKRKREGTLTPSEAKRVEVAIKVKWRINGTKKYSWETRSTIRRIFTDDIGDTFIYEAAKVQEEKYEAWQNGERVGLERSPSHFNQLSPGPGATDPPLQVPATTPPANPPSTMPGTTPPATPPSTVPGTTPPAKFDLKSYQELWCFENQVELETMTMVDRMACMTKFKSENQ